MNVVGYSVFFHRPLGIYKGLNVDVYEPPPEPKSESGRHYDYSRQTFSASKTFTERYVKIYVNGDSKPLEFYVDSFKELHELCQKYNIFNDGYRRFLKWLRLSGYGKKRKEMETYTFHVDTLSATKSDVLPVLPIGI